MFGDEFGFDYFQQRHTELLQAVERVRLIQCLEKVKRAEQRRLSLGKRVLAAIGNGLVLVGSRLQQAAAQ
jgi:hypothetical protein